MPRQVRVRGTIRRKPGAMFKTVGVKSHQRTISGGRSKASNPGCPLAVLALTLAAALAVVAVRAVTA